MITLAGSFLERMLLIGYYTSNLPIRRKKKIFCKKKKKIVKKKIVKKYIFVKISKYQEGFHLFYF